MYKKTSYIRVQVKNVQIVYTGLSINTFLWRPLAMAVSQTTRFLSRVATLNGFGVTFNKSGVYFLVYGVKYRSISSR